MNRQYNKKFIKQVKPLTTKEKLDKASQEYEEQKKKDVIVLPEGCKTILSVNGYSIPKSGTSSHIMSKIRRDLTIQPHVDRPEYGMNVQPVKIFEETEKRIYMPRFYGITTFGKPILDKLTFNDQVIQNNERLGYFNPSINLRENQVPVIEKMIAFLKENYGGVLSCFCGFGKCMKKGTEIIMSDGTIKKVEDVKVGDQLMGDDSMPRNVLSLARGREMMYEIIPEKGDSYTVNESHILSLKITGHKHIIKDTRKGKQKGWITKHYDHASYTMKHTRFSTNAYGTLSKAKEEAEKFIDSIKTDDVVDIPLKDYLNLPEWNFTRAGILRGYRVPIIFPEKNVTFDPYMLGHWLGDGSSGYAAITTQDENIVEYYKKTVTLMGPNMIIRRAKETLTYRITDDNKRENLFLNQLRKYDLINNKHIPHVYKCNSRNIQLSVLAGLIDSDGHYVENCYEIVQKRKVLADDIVFLCRSLGFAAYSKSCKKTCSNARDGPKSGTYYRVTISGSGLEEIPVLLEYKKAYPRKQIKDALVTKITVKKLEVDNYYGFTLDGNHRYLLGDFQVSHNTLSALYICSKFKIKTAVICHTTDLMYQWKEEIQKLLPKAKIGLIQQKKTIIEGRDIIIVSLKTLAQREFPPGLFDDIGLSIWDEIHLMVTQLFSKGFMKMITPYSFGLSATPFRKDQCEKIFYNFIGPVAHYEKRGPNSMVRVDCVVYKAKTLKIEKNFKGDMLYTTTVVNICYNEERIKFLAAMIAKVVSQIGRKILVLSEYVDHLKQLKEAIEEATKDRLEKNLVARPVTCGLYIGEMKNEERVVSRECDVILGTYKIASVGMDIPALNTLFLASPRKDIEQSVGRIFRKAGKLKPRIIDLIDDHNIFISQSRVRKEFYKQYEYTIIQSKVDWTGKVSSQRVLFDVTKMKNAKKPRTVESLMAESNSNQFDSNVGGDSDEDENDSFDHDEEDELVSSDKKMPILHNQDNE